MSERPQFWERAIYIYNRAHYSGPQNRSSVIASIARELQAIAEPLVSDPDPRCLGLDGAPLHPSPSPEGWAEAHRKKPGHAGPDHEALARAFDEAWSEEGRRGLSDER